MEINQKIRIGMLTPSSNSIVEPWCYKIIGPIENASVHFGRVEVPVSYTHLRAHETS